MHIKLYYNDTILTPMKCGTRYLDEVFKDNTPNGFALNEVKRTLFLPKVKYIILRPPIEHLKSALHTAMLTEYNFGEKKENEFIIDFKPIVDEFCYWENDDDVQNTHWRHDVYETLYWTWRRNRDNINIIELKDLSFLLEKLKIENLPKYDSKNYEFKSYKYWCSKDEIMLFIKTNYPIQWNNYMQQIDRANVFYNHLMNTEIIDIKFV